MKEIRCSEFVELVTAFLDGALAPGTEGRVGGHLATCPGCAPYLDQFRRTIEVLGGLGAHREGNGGRPSEPP